MNSNFAKLAIEAAKQGGAAILKHYRGSLSIHTKTDGSPLTLADQESHQIILNILKASGLPLVSEEGSDLLLSEANYWLVDPLDGTKEFIAQNDEFTVNIALIQNQLPVLGVIYAPALDELYFGEKSLGAWVEKNGVRASCAKKEKSRSTRVATSRFHPSSKLDRFISENQIVEQIPVGSALKYARLATAEIDVFPRFVGSSEWDIAAGQAILEATGGSILNWNSGKPLDYGKPGRRNPRLIALRAPYTFQDFKLEKLDESDEEVR